MALTFFRHKSWKQKFKRWKFILFIPPRNKFGWYWPKHLNCQVQMIKFLSWKRSLSSEVEGKRKNKSDLFLPIHTSISFILYLDKKWLIILSIEETKGLFIYFRFAFDFKTKTNQPLGGLKIELNRRQENWVTLLTLKIIHCIKSLRKLTLRKIQLFFT